MRYEQRVSLSKDWSRRYVDFYFWFNMHNGKLSFPIAEDYKEIDESEEITPLLHLSYDACQDIMLELWELGFRPTQDTKDISINQTVEAHKQHIADLRNVTQKLLDKV